MDFRGERKADLEGSISSIGAAWDALTREALPVARPEGAGSCEGESPALPEARAEGSDPRLFIWPEAAFLWSKFAEGFPNSADQSLPSTVAPETKIMASLLTSFLPRYMPQRKEVVPSGLA